MKNQSDKLETFIREHRSEFDVAVPDRSIWLGIEQSLERESRGSVVSISWQRIAAVMVGVLACGVLIGIGFNDRRSYSGLDYTVSPALMQLKDAETYYQTQVNLKLDQLKNPEIKANAQEDLRQLDLIYEQLRLEMVQSRYADSETLINAMIVNYKTRIDILENILNKQNIMKNENHPISL